MNLNRSAALLAVVAGLVLSPAAHATTITFDESPATNNNVGLTNAYGGLGVTFLGTNAGTQNGISQGDIGSWGLQGTNGPQFLGFNSSNAPGYSETIQFATPVGSVSIDVSRSNGSTNGFITLNAFDGAVLVDTATVTLGAINAWSTLTVSAASITRVDLAGTGSSFHPFGVDNLVFDAADTPTPEPASIAILGLAIAGLGVLRRHRTS